MVSLGNNKMHSLLILLVILAIFLLPGQGETKMYKYKDESGKWHFTDDPNQIPEPFRNNEDAGDQLADQIKETTRVTLGDGYSIEINSDWKAKHTGSLVYKLVTTAQVDDYTPSLGFDVMKVRGTRDAFTEDLFRVLRKRFQKFKELGRTPFSAENADGERFVTDYEFAGEKVRTLYYIFENTMKEKVVVTCRVATETGDKFDNAFDEMVRSFIIE